MGAHGDVALAWASAGTNAEMVTRPSGGGFSPIVDLSPAGSEFATAAVVAEDGAGEAVAVWNSSVEKSNLIIEAAVVTGGVRSTPSKLSAPGQNAVLPTLAVDERGDAVVAWMRSNGSHNVVQASFRQAGGSFSAPVNLSAESGNANAPKVAIDSAGEAIVVWEQSDVSNEVVEEATRPAAGTSFTTAVALSNPAEGAIQPSVAMNSEGDTAISWVHLGSSNVVQARVRPSDGKFSAAANLSGEGMNAEHPQVALDGHGNPTVIWARNFVIQYANGTAAGAFSPDVNLAFEAWYPSIAEDAAGDTLVGYPTVQSVPAADTVFRPAGGTFGSDDQMSLPGQSVFSGEGDVSLGINSDGDGAVGFVGQESGGADFLDMSLLDTAGVSPGRLSIPATATAGVPVTFAAEPVDEIFPTPTVSWAFGDASTAGGQAVTHAFANPGTYSVSVTVTAAPGDSVTHTGTITVTAPPVSVFHTATLGSRSVTADSHGRVHLKVACPAGGAACAGTVTLTLPATASALAVAARAKGTAVIVPAGQVSFSAAAGSSITVSVALPSTVLRLLERHHRLTLTVALESHDASGQSATTSAKVLVNAYVKPKKPKRKKKKK
jgi:PKD domain